MRLRFRPAVRETLACTVWRLQARGFAIRRLRKVTCVKPPFAILERMASYQHIDHGFDPVFDEHSRILVLGSFPSVLSRRNAFYYGNPQNRFWRVLAACLSEPVPPNESDNVTLEQSIAAKKELLLAHGIALWDVIESCDIKGSSDASIKNVVPAHVERVLEAAHIGGVVCNGGAAARLYKRYLQWQVGLTAHALPSTSPANAAWQLERLTERWRAELVPLLQAAADGTLGEAPAPSSIKRSFVTAKVAKLDGDAHPANGSGGRNSESANSAAESGEGAPSELSQNADAAHGVERIEYASIRVAAPPASSYAVHKSMQGNKRANTKPELLVRERLRAAGLTGYRLQWKVPGHPDIAWPGKRVALEVRGCFWHRCPHCHPSTPKKNTDYWEAKFARNIERDEENLHQLQAMGWRVHVIWECQLKKKTIDATMADLLPKLAEELGKKLAESSAAQLSAKSESGSPRPHYMYVIECADGSLYTGYTPDVEARFSAHQAGTGAKYTRGRGPLNLLAVAEFNTKHDAMSAEYHFKQLTRNQKDKLLAKAAQPNADFANILTTELHL